MSTTIGRRGFLQVIVVTAAVHGAGCSSEADETPQGAGPVEDGKKYFPQSVASGDPRPTSVVLWTRVADPEAAGKDATVSLEISTTADFKALVASKSKLPAMAADDGTLKVKVQGLTARTVYYFRFVYEKGGKRFASQTGRTKTAPSATDDTPVRFALASCQDFIGRHYHVWQRLLDVNPDLDAILFVGDYIYETTGDPDFQTTTGTTRVIKFTDQAGALDVNGDGKILAAKSVDNYRELYKQFRADPVLQKIHEMWPLIITWDDHEFSDDSHGATATYSDGVRKELDEERKRNAERAFFEFTPVDAGDAPDGRVDTSKLPVYPETKIWRDFEFGKNVRLVVTDYRSHRPDHLVPEDAYPGTVIVDEAEMKTSGLDMIFKSDSFAYVNIDDPAYAGEKYILQQANKVLATREKQPEAAGTARAANDVKGNLALVFVNAVLEAAMATPISPVGKPRGMAWVHFGKQTLWGLRGSRYIVLKDTYDAWSAYMYKKTGGKSENAYGDAQDAWVKQKLGEAKPWKIVATSVSMTAMVLDFRDKMDITVSALRNRFYANTDGWDGFPNKKSELLKAGGGSTIFVAGDIHASYVSNEETSVSITAPAITSGTFQDLLKGSVVAAGYDAAHPVYKYAVTELDASLTAGNPGLVYANSTHHGIAVLEIGATEATATYHLIPGTEALSGYDKAAEVKAKFIEKKFKISGGKVTAA